ncbi:GrpB family protein [Streptococcus sanguinis]|uniref:GrpB family protein n=1 Tax=Streptococcus sanguinis TaxID=1305 RepID=UPI00066DBD4B|nr:GrpB family protein [Streptococcus sanguinis]MBZ2057086.1 GrpB family protein [Streptococcus sanguinis]PLA64719.1 GrpB family protein [Streptococcus salivarius]RSI38834.1 dephospho-CoA kinase/protein folding accessory domain-containing protein [Streptococcus sanguinis]
MSPSLEEMSLEELWQLFPIFLRKHQDECKDWYEEERLQLLSFLPEHQIVRLSHIGSTSVKTIWAKPIVDILLEIPKETDMAVMRNLLLQNGYLLMSESKGRMSFNKGYTPSGFAERVFHLHLRYEGDHDELYFRDYLQEHPAVAKDYEKLKLSLWKQYEHNRDAYTEAKTEFIKNYTEKAKKIYGGRYEREDR